MLLLNEYALYKFGLKFPWLDFSLRRIEKCCRLCWVLLLIGFKKKKKRNIFKRCGGHKKGSYLYETFVRLKKKKTHFFDAVTVKYKIYI